jgi:hypothetical protein
MDVKATFLNGDL